MRHAVSSRVETKRRHVHARMVGTAILVALSAAACIFDQGNPDKSAGRRDSDDNQGGAQQSSGASGASGVIPTPTTTNTPDTSTPDTAQPIEAGNDADAADTG